ncbi:hypothetical protein DQ238_19430 [Geodermatophilus sp. TF02-6]|uniref:hypothetical protein n=1 Tax=Geodermatophilus sp. TF02-6 TaxID=2250575 RepID=UPI000DE9D7FC|nr:hypothetical protein [Geodermatophilus sp. TF02-6]RBY75520.1 hypothetical protein DQ238_19430 [Geodermatophilus sp. TF02-6]
MTGSADRATVQVRAEGRVLAEAEVHPTDEPGVVASDMHVESGHLPMGTRTRLVDAVLEHPYVDEAERLVATMPISDTEMLDRVRERAEDVETRAAGATKIVRARLEHGA